MNTCRLCGEESQFIKLDIEIENGNNYLIECNNCHSIFTKYQTPPTKVSKIYNDLFTNGEYERHRKEFYKLISGKSSYFPFRKFLFNRVRKKLSGDIIVEIGGGVGAFGQYVTKKGYKYQDFDISKNAIQYVKALGLSGVVFDPENLITLDFHNANLVVMWEVIEHIWDVAGYLQKIHENLAPKSFLLLSTPNIRRHDYLKKISKPSTSSPPIHINFFSKESLSISLKSANFIDFRFFHKRLERPNRNLSNINYIIGNLLGIEPEKTLYCLAKKA